jgi:tRNA(fMet)-specific endonuclease VapC
VTAAGTPVVVDTGVFSALLSPGRSPLAKPYRELLTERPMVLSFQSVAELRYGTLRARWGELRRRRLERVIAGVTVVQSGDELSSRCAWLRYECEQIAHALGQKGHEADRWIAATALELGVPLVSHDQFFRDVPNLGLETALPPHE